MAPPQFSKIGKKSKDLLGKEFSGSSSIKYVSQASDQLKFETNGSYAGDSGVALSKVSFNNKEGTQVEVQLHTAGKPADTSAKLTLSKLATGLELVLGFNASPDASLEASYAQDLFAVNTKVSTNLDTFKHSISASASAGKNGFVVGGCVNLTVADAPEVTCFSAGAEYSQKDFTVTAKGLKSFGVLQGAAYYKYSSDVNLALDIKADPEKGSVGLTAGADYKLSASTTLKAKTTSTGVVSLAAVHNMINPALKFAVATELSPLAEKSVAPKFGLNLTFGDY